MAGRVRPAQAENRCGNVLMRSMARTALLLSLSLGWAHAAFRPFEIVAGLPHRSPAELEAAFWGISSPAHSSYLKHLTLPQAADLVGSDEATTGAVRRWLLACGADSVTTSSLRDTMTGRFDTSPDSVWNSSHLVLPPPLSGVSLDFLLRRDPTEHSAGTQRSSNKAINVGAGGGGYTISKQKKAYGIPDDLTATNDTGLQLVWGPGTFGFSMNQLEQLKRSEVPLLNTSRVTFDTPNHGEAGGDNFGEGQLDTDMVSSFGLNVRNSPDSFFSTFAFNQHYFYRYTLSFQTQTRPPPPRRAKGSESPCWTLSLSCRLAIGCLRLSASLLGLWERMHVTSCAKRR